MRLLPGASAPLVVAAERRGAKWHVLVQYESWNFFGWDRQRRSVEYVGSGTTYYRRAPVVGFPQIEVRAGTFVEQAIACVVAVLEAEGIVWWVSPDVPPL